MLPRGKKLTNNKLQQANECDVPNQKFFGEDCAVPNQQFGKDCVVPSNSSSEAIFQQFCREECAWILPGRGGS